MIDTPRILDGKALAAGVLEECRTEAAALTEKGIVPGLAVVLVGDDPASRVYVGSKVRTCGDLGLHSLKIELPATTTREESPATGRMTDWIRDGRLAAATGGPLDPQHDRVMICGSMGMLKEHKALCEAAGMREGANSEPGHFVIEKAFVD